MLNLSNCSVNNAITSNSEIENSGNTDGQRTHGGASGRSDQRNVGSIAPESRLNNRGQDSHLASPATEHHSMLSNMVQPLVSLSNRAGQVINCSRRILRLVRPLSSAFYYRNPAAIKHILQQGGVFGKIAQTLAVNPRLLSAIHSGSEDERNRFYQEIGNALSQYQPGEVPPDEVISTLQGKIAGVIQHVRTLGRGTICQIDHVLIDGKDYAVKSLSPELSEAIKSDVDIVSNLFIPVAAGCGMLSKADIHTFSDPLKTFSDETDLSRELKHTELQAGIFEALTNDNEYKNFLTVNSETGEHPVTVAFKVPEVYPDFSSNQGLVMELVDGCSLDRQAEIRRMLQSWEPAWNNRQSLNGNQIGKFSKIAGHATRQLT